MKKKLKWVLVSLILFVLILVISIGIITSNESKTNEVKEEELIFKEEKDNQEEKKDQPLDEETKVFVDIKGAVLNPGVYEIEKDKKIIDQTTPNMIQRISEIFERKPLISKEI